VSVLQLSWVQRQREGTMLKEALLWLWILHELRPESVTYEMS
jgi:hypothetical protein